MRRLARFIGLVIVAMIIDDAAWAEDLVGRVIGVADGDTITILTNRLHPVKVRLAGIDCPEKRQAFGMRAKQFTSALAFHQTVTVTAHGVDRHGRTIGEVLLPDGRSLNQKLVRAGLAWWYRRYSTDHVLSTLEASARLAHRGLWADPDAVPPWLFRHRHRRFRMVMSSVYV